MVGRTRRGDTGAIGARIASAVAESGGAVPAACRAGVSVSAVRSWCSGTSMPSADRLADLCRACGVSADWVLGLGGPDAGR